MPDPGVKVFLLEKTMADEPSPLPAVVWSQQTLKNPYCYFTEITAEHNYISFPKSQVKPWYKI